jgi:HD-GYP domain-containing protein (c-di-GMP phosphodiesterase class II)
VSNSQVALCGISPGIEGLRWETGAMLRVGRQNTFEVVIQHPSISRQHAEVVVRGQGGAIRDLGSAKGTFLNGVPVGRAYQKLRSNDTIHFGELAMRVEIVEPMEAAPPRRPDVVVPPISDTGSAAHLRASGCFLKIQAATQHSWEQTLEGSVLRRDEHLGKGNHLLGLLRMGHYLCHMDSLSELLQAILDDTVAVLDAQRGCLILADEETGALDLHAISFSKKPKSCSKTFSRTLAMHCFHQGKSLLCRDVNVDQELLRATSISSGSMASIICVLLRSPRKRLGVLHLDRGPFQEPFSQEDFHLADAIAASMSYGIENAQLAESQRDLFLHTVTALAQAVELRDTYTGNHTQRVTQYSLMLAHELKLSQGEIRHIQVGTPLHDIGKIAIDDAVLRKPGKLTPEEFEQMKSHVVKGAAILGPIPGMKPMLPIVRSHHERWDGEGYPDKLAGDQIPLFARIVAVADAFDAMTSDRPYRPAMPMEKAFAELAKHSGAHFDPLCAQAFLRMRPRVEAALAVPVDPPLLSSMTDSMMKAEVIRLLSQGPALATAALM